MRNRTVGTGFTLIELLVVIAIIGIIAGLLIPTLFNALEGSRQARCLSNLRQWSLALSNYSSDNDGLLTTEGNDGLAFKINEETAWFNALPPYMEDLSLQERNATGQRMPQPKSSSIFMCPSFPKYSSVGKKDVVLAYGQNKFIEENERGRPPVLRMQFIPNPSLFVHLGEVDSVESGTVFANTWSKYLAYRHGKKAQGANGSSAAPYAYGSGTGVNLGFVDGHAGKYNWEDIYFSGSSSSSSINKGVMWDPLDPIITN